MLNANRKKGAKILLRLRSKVASSAQPIAAVHMGKFRCGTGAVWPPNSIRAERDRLESGLADARAEIDRLRKACGDLQLAREYWLNRAEALEAELSDTTTATKRVEELERQLAAETSAVLDLTSERAALRKQIRRLAGAKHELARELAEARNTTPTVPSAPVSWHDVTITLTEDAWRALNASIFDEPSARDATIPPKHRPDRHPLRRYRRGSST